MSKMYAALILIICVFLLSKLLPENTNKFSYKKPVIVSTKGTNMNEDIAILAGGCFWCMEHPFEDLPGVILAISGYTGGKKKNPP